MKNDRPIEYKMTKKMFNSILNTRKESEKSLNPYNYVMDIINEQWRLRGKVTKLFIY